MSKTELLICSPYFIFFIVSLSVMKPCFGSINPETRLILPSLVNHKVNSFDDNDLSASPFPSLPPVPTWDSYQPGMVVLEDSYPPSSEQTLILAFDGKNLSGIVLKLLCLCATDLGLKVTCPSYMLLSYVLFPSSVNLCVPGWYPLVLFWVLLLKGADI